MTFDRLAQRAAGIAASLEAMIAVPVLAEMWVICWLPFQALLVILLIFAIMLQQLSIASHRAYARAMNRRLDDLITAARGDAPTE